MYKVILEIYGALFTVNAFIGIFQFYYIGAFPNNVLRSPINQEPLILTKTPSTSSLILNATAPLNSTGNPIEWVIQSTQNFAGVLSGLLDFINFLAGGFIAGFINSLGLPGDVIFLLMIPLGLYTLYTIIVFITNRGQ